MIKTTLEQTRELHQFLRGELPEEIHMKDPPKLDPDKAFRIIWFLQEHMGVISDNFEMCEDCKEIYDSDSGGARIYCKNYCDWCEARHTPKIENWDYGCIGCPEEGLCPFNLENEGLMHFQDFILSIGGE